MTTVAKNDIKNAALALGIKKGDIVLIHSSFKSMGYVEGGAEAVISGFLDALGTEGTLVLPTFCQKNFEKAYETWHIDKESDVGYLTNYFRKREGSIRSDQATHSVAACGKLAKELTKTHGHTHKRFGNMGDTPFSADSPWEKMYTQNAKIVLLGVPALYTTFRHYAEYVFIEECLQALCGHTEYDDMKNALWSFEKTGVWPHLYNETIRERLEEKNLVEKSTCGDATLLCYEAKVFVDFALNALRNNDCSVLWDNFDVAGWLDWRKRLDEITK